MAAPWLTDVLGPSTPGRVVSVRRTGGPSAPTATNQPGSLGGLDIPTLLAKMQSQTDAANNAGLEQYKNLMASVNGTSNNVIGAGGLFDQASQQLGGMGTSARNRIQGNTVRQKAQASQDLVSRGLNNTTIGASMNRGIDSDAEAAQQSIDEQVATARSGLLTQRAGATADLGRLTADSILSKRNVAPESDVYANLIAQLARNGGGSAGGVGSMEMPPMMSGGNGGGSGDSGGSDSPGYGATGGGGGGSGNNGVQTFTGAGNKGGLATVRDPNTLAYWKGWDNPQAKLYEYQARNGNNRRNA